MQENKKPSKQIDGIRGVGYRIHRQLLRRIARALGTNKKSSTFNQSIFLNFLNSFPAGWGKNYSVFLSGVLIFLLAIFGLSEINRGQSLKKQVLGEATAGFDFFNQAKEGLANQDFTSALIGFSKAGESFGEARLKIEQAGGVVGGLARLLPQGGDVNQMFQAAAHISSASELLIAGVQGFGETKLVWDEERNSSGLEFYLKTRNSREQFVKSLEELNLALALLSEVDSSILPLQYRDQYEQALSQLSLATRVLDDTVGIQSVLLNLLGGSPKTYLLIFQNNNEARATGGFIGTYGTLHFANGQMRIGKIESIYALDGQLSADISPPLPITRFLTDEWGTRDSNWFVDFPTSARKIIEFYELASREQADGVISMTPDVFEKLLAVTGPVTMGEYDEVLTAENFRERVQFKTSIDYDRVQNRPKKFLADFALKLLGEFSDFSSEQFLQAFDVMLQMAQEKQILLFALDNESQAEFDQLDLSGKVVETDGDYLAIFHSNLGGGKTNVDIGSTVEKTVSISHTGEAEVQLKVTREHQSFDELYFPRNVDFMRILVPPGSRLTSASGFDPVELTLAKPAGYKVDRDVAFWESQLSAFGDTGVSVGFEAGYTEFSGWLELDPGETRSVILTYTLPFEVDRVYTQLLQKQPGSQEFDFSLEVRSDKLLRYTYPQRFQVAGGSAGISEVVRSDRFYAVIGE